MEKPEQNDAPSLAQSSVDAKVSDAAGWCVALGAVSFVASLFQLFGVVDPGVPVWINLAVPIALIGLGLNLNRQSIVAAGVLAALFVAMVVNTLIVTGAYFSQGGFLATAIMIVRYIILLNAARAVGQALFGMIEYRRTAVNAAALRSPAAQTSHAASTGAQQSTGVSTHAQPELSQGVNGAAVYLALLGGMMLVLTAVLLFSEMAEDIPGFVKIGPLLLAGGMFYLARVEHEHLPKKAGELRAALSNGDDDNIKELSALFEKFGRRSSRALARETLSGGARQDTAFQIFALDLIGKIGILEQDAATAVHIAFIENTSDNSVESAARACLKAIGYDVPAQHAEQ